MKAKCLKRSLINALALISDLLDQVIAMDPERIDGVRERLTKGIEEIKREI